MDLRQFRYFVQIVESGSLSKAAEVLHVAQPALSQQIRQLEAELGIELLWRHARGVRPTGAGETLLAHARDILHRVAELRAILQAESAEPSGEVRLGLPTTVARHLGGHIKSVAEEKFPRLIVQIVEGMSGFLSDWLVQGDLDVAVLYDPSFYPRLPPDIFTKQILKEEIRLIFRAGSQPNTPRSFEGLATEPVVLPRRLHAIRMLINDFATEHGVVLNVVGEADSLPTLIDLVHSGVSTLLPALAVGPELASGVLESRPMTPSLIRTLHAVWPRRSANRLAALAVVEAVEQVTAALVSDAKWGAHP